MKKITIDGVDYALTPIKNETEQYYFISDAGFILRDIANPKIIDYRFRKKAGNVFMNKKDAEEALKMIHSRDELI